MSYPCWINSSFVIHVIGCESVDAVVVVVVVGIVIMMNSKSGRYNAMKSLTVETGWRWLVKEEGGNGHDLKRGSSFHEGQVAARRLPHTF